MSNLTKSGKLSLKPRDGRQWKRLKRISIAAELEKHFIPDADVANHLGITVAGLQAIKSTPEFLAVRLRHQTGILSNYEQKALETQEGLKDYLDDMIPTALTAVRKIIQDPLHKDHAKVALDMIDRVPVLAKISRNDHYVHAVVDTTKENLQAQELLAMLEGRSAAPELPPPAPEPEFIAEAETEESSGTLDELETIEDNIPHKIVVM